MVPSDYSGLLPESKRGYKLRWTKIGPPTPGPKGIWLTPCRCICGKEKMMLGGVRGTRFSSFACSPICAKYGILDGKRFGILTIRSLLPLVGDTDKKIRRVMVSCDCSPDRVYPICFCAIAHGQKSCGCLSKRFKMFRRLSTEFVGQFGLLTDGVPIVC